MIDDKSREAFEAWAKTEYLDSARKGDYYYNSVTTAALQAWNEATRRERERIDTAAIAWAYGKLRNFGVLDNTMDNAMMADRLMAMMQEPKE